MKLIWLLSGCLLFTACSKDEIYEPQSLPTQQTGTSTNGVSTPAKPPVTPPVGTPASPPVTPPTPPQVGTPITPPPVGTPTLPPGNPISNPAISLELDGRLPKDKNGYYHLILNKSSNQTIHRVTGKVLNTKEPTKVEWESNLFWWLKPGEVVARITKTYINTYTGQLTYVNLPPITNWREQLVPTTNCCSYVDSKNEVNTIIAPIYKMKGDTLVLTASIKQIKLTQTIKIVLE